MGCDIHLYVEKLENGEWVHAQEMKQGYRVGLYDVPYEEKIYTSRNYLLFSILAGVRMYDDTVIPISDPRGLPDDVSSDIEDRSEEWGGDGHSHSYLTLQEIFDYDWTQNLYSTAFVNTTGYFMWNRWKREEGLGPDHIVSDYAIKDDLVVSEEEIKGYIQTVIDRNGGKMYNIEDQIEQEFGKYCCNVTWMEPYSSVCKEFWYKAIPKLLTYGKPDEVRIVFWLDN